MSIKIPSKELGVFDNYTQRSIKEPSKQFKRNAFLWTRWLLFNLLGDLGDSGAGLGDAP